MYENNWTYHSGIWSYLLHNTVLEPSSHISFNGVIHSSTEEVTGAAIAQHHAFKEVQYCGLYSLLSTLVPV